MTEGLCSLWKRLFLGTEMQIFCLPACHPSLETETETAASPAHRLFWGTESEAFSVLLRLLSWGRVTGTPWSLFLAPSWGTETVPSFLAQHCCWETKL